MLEIEHLCVSLGDFSVTDLNLHIKRGQYTVLLGPTGAGKTILLETIAGIHRPDSGHILLNGCDVTQMPPEKRGIGMVYQDYMLFAHMTVAQNMGFGLRQRRCSKADIETRVLQTAEMLGISHLLSRYPKTLSGGEQQRAALGRALLLQPSVLLLDEPLSALDTQTREKIRAELRRISQDTGVTILHITHHFEDMYSLADYTVVMRDGRIVQTGTPDEILSSPATDFIAEFTGMENLFTGTARPLSNGLSEICLGGCSIVAVTEYTGQVRVGIRPENMLLSLGRVESSAQNMLPATVCQIVDSGAYVKVIVDAGVRLSVVLTKQGAEHLKICTGMTVWVTFKAAVVHVYTY